MEEEAEKMESRGECDALHYIMNVQSDGLRTELCLKMLPFLVKSFSTSCYNNVKHRN